MKSFHCIPDASLKRQWCFRCKMFHRASEALKRRHNCQFKKSRCYKCRQAHARTLTRRVEFSLRKRPSFVPKRKKKHVKIEHNHKETLDSHSVQSLVEEAPLSQRIFEVVGFVSCAESKNPIKDFVPNVTDKRCHKTVLFFVLQLQLFLVLADAKMIQSGSKRNQT